MEKHPTYAESSTRSSFTAPRIFELEPGRSLLAAPAQGSTCLIDWDGDQPEALVITYADGFGFGIGYSSPAALEAWANVLLRAAEELRVKPAKPREVA